MQKYAAIASALKKEARVTKHVISNCPRYEGTGGVIYAPEGRTKSELYVLAHECGHAFHRHPRRCPKWLAEYEAETWAHEALHRHGIKISKEQTRLAKRNVRMEIDVALDFSDKGKALAAAEWSGTTLPPE
jgi:hypothetical protein